MGFTRRESIRVVAAATLTVAAGRVTAESHSPTVHEVQMLNAHPEDKKERMVYFPAVVRAQPGDTIRWVSVDRGHNTQGDAELIPEGAEPWKSKINDDFEMVVEAEGAYGYICTPHSTTGMVGLILVGNVDNLDALKEVRQRGKARQRFEQYFAEAEELLASESS